MKRRQFITIAIAALISAPSVLLADVATAVVRQLRAQGYTAIEVSRTWLGRLQVEAKRAGEEREIILNRKTGEILRDYSRRISDDDQANNEEPDLLEHQEGNGESGSQGGEDNEDGGSDDSGSGSDNSGSGSENSGSGSDDSGSDDSGSDDSGSDDSGSDDSGSDNSGSDNSGSDDSGSDDSGSDDSGSEDD